MYEIFTTAKGTLENKKWGEVEDYNRGQKVASELLAERPLEICRVLIRPKRSVLEKFWDTEAQVIIIGLNDLCSQDSLAFNLNGNNLYPTLASYLIDKYKSGGMPWCDMDLIGQTLSKLDELSPEECQQLLDEYHKV